jgi:hypothetical protein
MIRGVAKSAEGLGQIAADRAATSCGEQLVMNMMQPNDFRAVLVVGKMTTHSVADVLAQLLGAVGLREDRFANGTRRQATVWVLLDDKNNLCAHAVILPYIDLIKVDATVEGGVRLTGNCE